MGWRKKQEQKKTAKAPTVHVLLSALQVISKYAINAVGNGSLDLSHLGHSRCKPSRRKDSPGRPWTCVLPLLLLPPTFIVPALHACLASGKKLPECAPFVRKPINCFNHGTVITEESQPKHPALCGACYGLKGLLQACLLCTVSCVSRPAW